MEVVSFCHKLLVLRCKDRVQKNPTVLVYRYRSWHASIFNSQVQYVSTTVGDKPCANHVNKKTFYVDRWTVIKR